MIYVVIKTIPAKQVSASRGFFRFLRINVLFYHDNGMYLEFVENEFRSAVDI